jgi:uncharacterized DUF497 family protein
MIPSFRNPDAPMDIDKWLYKNTHLKPAASDATMQVAGFEWDEGNRSKCQKHGVSPAAIEDILRRPIAIQPDPMHSKLKERFIAIGKDGDGRGIFVVFTIRTRRGARLIRPIGARYMHKKELDHYEKETAAPRKR